MRMIAPLVCIALVAAALGCSTRKSMYVNTDYDPHALPDFPFYETYSWLPENGDREIDEVVAARITNAVDRELDAKGFHLVENIQGPDFLVGYHVAIDDKLGALDINSYYGYHWGRWEDAYTPIGDPTTIVREFEQGTLIIDIVDGDSDSLAWRGTARTELKPESPVEDRRKLVRKAVEMILREFPPKKLGD